MKAVRKSDSEERVNELVFIREGAIAFINGDVNETMHRQFAEVLLTSPAEVGILFSTTGGDVNSALGIYDLIRNHGAVNIVINGECSSAGTLILQASKHRAATPSSQFLIHYGTEETSDRATLKHNREVERYWFSIFQKRTGATSRRVRRWHSGETFFSAHQALKEGLIDAITGSDGVDGNHGTDSGTEAEGS